MNHSTVAISMCTNRRYVHLHRPQWLGTQVTVAVLVIAL